MAGTVTVTEETHGVVKKVSWDWLGDGSGDADQLTTYAYSGEVVRVIQIPDTGATKPSATYDVVVNDQDGYDILSGRGANLSSVGTQFFERGIHSLGAVANDTLNLVVSNCGTTGGGNTIVYIR